MHPTELAPSHHIPTDSEDHLQYVFTALVTKSLEMHALWMPTGDEEECQHPCATRRT